jgi:hypothetical protein
MAGRRRQNERVAATHFSDAVALASEFDLESGLDMYGGNKPLANRSRPPRHAATRMTSSRRLYRLWRFNNTLLHKSPDMHNVKHKLVTNTLHSHHVKHDDTQVPRKCRRAGKQAPSRHPVWLDLSLKRVLSVEFVELSP